MVSDFELSMFNMMCHYSSPIVTLTLMNGAYYDQALVLSHSDNLFHNIICSSSVKS